MYFHLTFHGEHCCCRDIFGSVENKQSSTSEDNEKWNLFKWTLIYFFKRCTCTLSMPSEQIASLKALMRSIVQFKQLEDIRMFVRIFYNELTIKELISDLTKLVTYVFPKKFCVSLDHVNPYMDKRDWDLFQSHWNSEPSLIHYQSKDLRILKRWNLSKFHEVPIVLHLRDWRALKVRPFNIDQIQHVRKPLVVKYLLFCLPKELVNLILIYANYKIYLIP